MRRNVRFAIIAIVACSLSSPALAQPRTQDAVTCPSPRHPRRMRGPIWGRFQEAVRLADTNQVSAARAFDELVDLCPNAHQFAYNAVLMHVSAVRNMPSSERATPAGREQWSTAMSRVSRYLVSFTTGEGADMLERVRALGRELDRLRPADPAPEPPAPVVVPPTPPVPAVPPPVRLPPAPIVAVPSPPRFREVVERGPAAPGALALGGGVAALVFSGLSLGWAVNSQSIADAWRANGSPRQDAEYADRHERSVEAAYIGAAVSGAIGIGLGVLGAYLLTHRPVTTRRVPVAITSQGLSLAF